MYILLYTYEYIYMNIYIYIYIYKMSFIQMSKLLPRIFTLCKSNVYFQRFLTTDLCQFTTGTPSERLLCILQVAVRILNLLLQIFI